jgi:hypothetical protein
MESNLFSLLALAPHSASGPATFWRNIRTYGTPRIYL